MDINVAFNKSDVWEPASGGAFASLNRPKRETFASIHPCQAGHLRAKMEPWQVARIVLFMFQQSGVRAHPPRHPAGLDARTSKIGAVRQVRHQWVC
jgi:hypothetical protein